jgi:hypothetical protein
MPSTIRTITASKLRREMPKPCQILTKPSVAAAAAPTMTHPKTHLVQPDQNAAGPCGSIIDMPTTNTITQPAIDRVAAILILSFHHAIPSYPFRCGLGRTSAAQSAFRIHQFDANSGTLSEPKPGRHERRSPAFVSVSSCGGKARLQPGLIVAKILAAALIGRKRPPSCRFRH